MKLVLGMFAFEITQTSSCGRAVLRSNDGCELYLREYSYDEPHMYHYKWLIVDDKVINPTGHGRRFMVTIEEVPDFNLLPQNPKWEP